MRLVNLRRASRRSSQFGELRRLHALRIRPGQPPRSLRSKPGIVGYGVVDNQQRRASGGGRGSARPRFREPGRIAERVGRFEPYGHAVFSGLRHIPYRTSRTSVGSLVRNQHSASSHQLFYIAEAHAETKVVPNAFRNDLSRELMVTIQAIRHSFSMTSPQSPANVTVFGLPPNLGIENP